MGTAGERDREEIHSGFVRQRRSLIATSLVLLLYQAIGLTIRKLQVLGNEFEVARPEALAGALWVTWSYFLIRYYQHHHDLGYDRFTMEWRRLAASLTRDWARSQAERQVRANLPSILGPDAGEPIRIVVHDSPAPAPDPGRRLFHATVLLSHDFNGPKKQVEEFEVPISKIQHFLFSARSWVRVAVQTRYFTEFTLPYLVAVSPVAYALLARILGHVYPLLPDITSLRFSQMESLRTTLAG